LSRQGNLKAGIYQFGETLRLDPDNLKALNNMGVALALQGRYGEAANYFEAALKQNPRDADVHNNLGIALKKQGNPENRIRNRFD
jgi:Flp pilus assembly protein TadD